MSLTIGGMDVAISVINNEFRILILEQVTDRLLRVAPPGTLSCEDMDKIRSDAIEEIQKKYPDLGIKQVKNSFM